jgi:hypothetical protein
LGLRIGFPRFGRVHPSETKFRSFSVTGTDVVYCWQWAWEVRFSDVPVLVRGVIDFSRTQFWVSGGLGGGAVILAVGVAALVGSKSLP